MARQSANQLKVKKQVSGYVSQAHYRDCQSRDPLYSVKSRVTGKVVASHLTFLQATKQFGMEITQVELLPLQD